CRLFLTSRVRPAWITPRMTVYGDAVVVEMVDLAFTEDEAHQVLQHEPPDETTIIKRAQGWPAVIGLAARRRGSHDIDEALAPAALYDFFADDLFRSVSADLQSSFLLLAAGGDTSLDVAKDLLGG